MADDWPGGSEYIEQVRKELEEREKMKSDEELTPQQISDLKDAFKIFDAEGEGHINPQKLGKVMKKLGRNPTEAEVQDLIMAVDDDGNGQIEFDEFAAMMAKKMQEQTKDEEIREAFKVFDRNGNGYISADEIGVLLGSLGLHFSADELRDMVTAADQDGDSQINFEDFLATFKDES